MNYIALICARGGSKGLPGKNIRPLSGLPLIAWTIKIALQVERLSRVIVSTDSKDIAALARKYGAEVPFLRPSELAQDHSSEWLVWQHALDYLSSIGENYDGLVNLPPTAPLRSTDDVENCLNEFENSGADIVLTVSEANRSPYFNMIVNDEAGFSSLVIPPEREIHRRQDVPQVFDITTVAYVARPEYVMESAGLFEGKTRSVLVPRERAVDIDTLLDFKIAECLIN